MDQPPEPKNRKAPLWTAWKKLILTLLVAIHVTAYRSAEAQLVGYPAFPVSKSLVGSDFTIAVSAGYAEPTLGPVFPIAARAEWNGDRWTLAGSWAWLLASGDTEKDRSGAGLAIGWQVTPYRPDSHQVIWKPLARVELGVSYSETENRGEGQWSQVDVPLSVGFGWVVPVNELNVAAFLGPEARIRAVHWPSGAAKTETRAGAGLLAGLEAYRSNCVPNREACEVGWGLRVGADVLIIEDVRGGDGIEWSISLGPIRKFF